MADALGDVRKQLDTVDRRIVEALAERLRLVDDVAEAKGQEAASLRDREREEEILGRLAESARDVGIDESFPDEPPPPSLSILALSALPVQIPITYL